MGDSALMLVDASSPGPSTSNRDSIYHQERLKQIGDEERRVRNI